MASTTTKSYLSIKPGETKVLPKSAKILSVINYGDVQYTNSCTDFTDLVENASCYNLIWGMSRDSSEAMDPDSSYIKYISILGTKYELTNEALWGELNSRVLTGPSKPDDDDGLTILLKGIIPQSLMKIYNITVDIPDNRGRAQFTLNFQTTPTIADTIEMYIVGTAYPNGVYLRPVLAVGNCGDSGQS